MIIIHQKLKENNQRTLIPVWLTEGSWAVECVRKNIVKLTTCLFLVKERTVQ